MFPGPHSQDMVAAGRSRKTLMPGSSPSVSESSHELSSVHSSLTNGRVYSWRVVPRALQTTGVVTASSTGTHRAVGWGGAMQRENGEDEAGSPVPRAAPGVQQNLVMSVECLNNLGGVWISARRSPKGKS